MNWYKHAQTLSDPGKPTTTSPVIADRSLFWQFKFLNIPITINVQQVIHRASEYLKAINSTIFQNTAAMESMQSGGGLANVSSENPWTINIDFSKIENNVKRNIEQELQGLERQQTTALGTERLHELQAHPEAINKEFVKELTQHIQDEVVREYAQIMAHEAQHNLQMNATRSEIEGAKRKVLDNAAAILRKSPEKNRELENRIRQSYNTSLTNETLQLFNKTIQDVFEYVIDTSDAQSINDAVANLNKIQYMSKSQAEAEAERAEAIAR